jgi:hypothetical protein
MGTLRQGGAGLAAALLLALAAGCGGGPAGGDGDPPQAVFEPGGTVAVDDFNAYLAGVDEPWASDPKQVATRFAHPVRQEGEVVGTSVGAGDGEEQVAVVTVTGLADDSVAGRRTAVSLRPEGDGWRLVRAQWTQRCALERGHDDWSAEPCV